MRILAISVAPLSEDRVQGGSQRILLEVVDALAEAGHAVRVLSHGSHAADAGFKTPNGAVIEPVLALRGAFPAPYQAPPHRLVSAWREIESVASWADRVYLHADAVYFRDALQDLPVIRSLHDFVYEEALLSAFTLEANKTIVPSNYLADCILVTAGRVAPVGELVVVPNGVAPAVAGISPVLPKSVRPRESGDLILVHPHRLQPEKGLRDSMAIAREVARRILGRNVRLLVPAPGSDSGADDAAIGAPEVNDMAAEMGLEQVVEVHRWIDASEMQAYLAAGDVTLCPGSFVESFGLVPLESVAAGTPAVCARVGALREHAGIDGMSQFDHGDIEAAAGEIELLLARPPGMEGASVSVTERYSLARMRSAYVDALTGPLGSSPTAHRASTENPAWRLAPWCYVSGQRVYHDYLARFDPFPALTAYIEGRDTGFTLPGSAGGDDLANEFDRARAGGFVVET